MPPNDLTAGQEARLEAAHAITLRQLQLLPDLLQAAGIQNTPENRATMLAVLATNYSAEVAPAA